VVCCVVFQGLEDMLPAMSNSFVAFFRGGFLRAFLPFPCVSLLAYLLSCSTTTNQVPGFFPHFLDSF